ncbi:hypothetical protein HJ01_03569 [Flavobacterium frigoris PS1]|uniref:Uncharacterized protein n=1 Tax=Flavobacterium frigoris (strain PS1) TaxID=1086011 RepID=H7FWM5_FLAFP|nr:hypothetical protein HJ01_03569 [Flavobacterium frigoris PS1]
MYISSVIVQLPAKFPLFSKVIIAAEGRLSLTLFELNFNDPSSIFNEVVFKLIVLGSVLGFKFKVPFTITCPIEVVERLDEIIISCPLCIVTV